MMAAGVFQVKWNVPCNILASILEIVRNAAANWDGKQVLIASERGQKSTFSNAKAATTFKRWKRNVQFVSA
jgi:hypothetical protein